jgi:hypothetical protein
LLDHRLDSWEEHLAVVVGVQLTVGLEAEHPRRQFGHGLEHAVSSSLAEINQAESERHHPSCHESSGFVPTRRGQRRVDLTPRPKLEPSPPESEPRRFRPTIYDQNSSKSCWWWWCDQVSAILPSRT